jgi:hypothetical protein
MPESKSPTQEVSIESFIIQSLDAASKLGQWVRLHFKKYVKVSGKKNVD